MFQKYFIFEVVLSKNIIQKINNWGNCLNMQIENRVGLKHFQNLVIGYLVSAQRPSSPISYKKIKRTGQHW
jgi:hypothetical protein